MCVLTHVSRVLKCRTLWTVALQALLSMGFSRQEYWSGLPCPPPGDLSDPGIRTHISHIVGRIFTAEPLGKLRLSLTLEQMVWQQVLRSVQPKTETSLSISVCTDSVFFFLSYSVKLSQQVNNYVYLDRKLDFRISEREGQWYTQLFELEQCTTGTELSLSI